MKKVKVYFGKDRKAAHVYASPDHSGCQAKHLDAGIFQVLELRDCN
ncbi:hypothetical protein Barb6_03253 [Bacteroidales bacterium Barb6]|nr:hypothetical protein Barb6_03253 [Bacteroidales bacterium Barb6]OAV75919.1 hypothetical protein Barb7_00404 [Bacteroidales bacterium Barb7]